MNRETQICKRRMMREGQLSIVPSQGHKCQHCILIQLMMSIQDKVTLRLNGRKKDITCQQVPSNYQILAKLLAFPYLILEWKKLLNRCLHVFQNQLKSNILDEELVIRSNHRTEMQVIQNPTHLSQIPSLPNALQDQSQEHMFAKLRHHKKNQTLTKQQIVHLDYTFTRTTSIHQ